MTCFSRHAYLHNMTNIEAAVLQRLNNIKENSKTPVINSLEQAEIVKMNAEQFTPIKSDIWLELLLTTLIFEFSHRLNNL